MGSDASVEVAAVARSLILGGDIEGAVKYAYRVCQVKKELEQIATGGTWQQKDFDGHADHCSLCRFGKIRASNDLNRAAVEDPQSFCQEFKASSDPPDL